MTARARKRRPADPRAALQNQIQRPGATPSRSAPAAQPNRQPPRSAQRWHSMRPCQPLTPPKWQRGTFWTAGWSATRQTGWIWGCWGIRKTSPRPWQGLPSWIVTHLPTGCGVGPDFSTLRLAQQFCERIDALTDWRRIDFQCAQEKVAPLKPKIEAIIEEITHARGADQEAG